MGGPFSVFGIGKVSGGVARDKVVDEKSTNQHAMRGLGRVSTGATGDTHPRETSPMWWGKMAMGVERLKRAFCGLWGGGGGEK